MLLPSLAPVHTLLKRFHGTRNRSRRWLEEMELEVVPALQIAYDL